jgi:transcriptional regulator with GAF, ATPase, and Fis domain
MSLHQDFILAVWREACRHIAIAEFADVLTDLLAAKMPVARLQIRRINPQTSHLETVAETLRSGNGDSEKAYVACDREQMRRLVRWCRRGELKVRLPGGRAQHAAFAAIPSSWTGETLVGPLASEHGSFGVALVELTPPNGFTPARTRLFPMLLEPLSVALENDQRLRELNALREAAESEKRSLLARLGREDMSEAIIGLSGGLRTVMERVELVARSDVPVLLFGETGSGKEVVARAIHNRSLASKGPFIRVNCGAIPPELIDSELFGHEKGSFTGAGSVRRGWFERADEGTLFLDEMGDLPPAAQVRLLRVLQDGEFNRVGGEEPAKVQVRIVAATHRDLAAMVQAGTFREDLWYRLAVFPIVLPPLRERTEDIPALAEHFAQRAAKRFGLRPQSPCAADLALLTEYSWPGNVRELVSVIDRATILGDGERLEVAAALGGGAGMARPNPTRSPPPRGAVTEIIPLDDAAKQHIEMALAATEGRVEGPRGAAALLRINPHTLRARMRRLGIDWVGIRAAARVRGKLPDSG